MRIDIGGGTRLFVDIVGSGFAARIQAPTLVLAGRDDPITPHELATEILGLLPEGVGRLEVVEGAGHGTFRDRPEETEQILRAFLAEPAGREGSTDG